MHLTNGLDLVCCCLLRGGFYMFYLLHSVVLDVARLQHKQHDQSPIQYL